MVTLPAWLPWLDPRLQVWAAHDARNHLLRVYHVTWAIDHGIWYPRWLPDMVLGYGYPLLNFYAPAPYYLAWLSRHAQQLDVWDAYRAPGAVAAVVGAAGAYTLTASLWRRPAVGVLAALALLYGPYVFQVNLFIRGDVPEALALALLPWLLFAIRRLWLAAGRAHRALWLGTTTAVGAGIVLTHNLTALLAAPVALAWVTYLFVAHRSRAALLRVATAGMLAAGITGFFWLPAIGEGGLVHLEDLRPVDGIDPDWFVEPLGSSRPARGQPMDSRRSRAGLIDLHLHYPHQLVVGPKLSLAQAGLGLLALAAIAVGVLRPRFPAQEGQQRERAGHLVLETGAIAALLLVALVCWFLTLTWSAPLWTRVPGLLFVQFPWRFLGPLAICLAVAGAGALASCWTILEHRLQVAGTAAGWILAVLVGAMVLVNGLGDRQIRLDDSARRQIDGRLAASPEEWEGTAVNREFIPREVEIAVPPRDTLRIRRVYEYLFPERDWLGGLFTPLGGDLRLLGWRGETLRLSVRVANDAAEDGRLGIRQLRFAGWRAWRDGQPVPIETVPRVAEQAASLGFMVLTVPPGEHSFTVAYGPSPLGLAGSGVTLLTGIAAAGTLSRLLWPRRRAPMPALTICGVVLATGLVGYVCWRGARPAFERFASLPVPEASAVGGVWATHLPGPTQAALLVNVAEAARRGQAHVDSPTGPSLGPDRFVDVRQLTVTDRDAGRGRAGTSRRQWLFSHPPSAVSIDVAVPGGRTTWFQAAVALDPATWQLPLGDGVRFQASVSTLNANGGEEAVEIVLDRTISPRAFPDQQRWVPVDADLSRWSGRLVRLTLRTLPGDDAFYDWAGWGNPMVITRESARARPAPSTTS